MSSNLVVLSEHFAVQFFGFKIIGLSLYQILAQRLEARASLVVVAAAHPNLHDNVLKLPLLSQITQQRLDFADDHLKHVDLVLQDIEDMVFNRLSDRKIEDENISSLTDPVQPPDPLFDPHRIPREIQVDERIAELQVSALAARFR